jgi:hypothetical protein
VSVSYCVFLSSGETTRILSLTIYYPMEYYMLTIIEYWNCPIKFFRNFWTYIMLIDLANKLCSLFKKSFPEYQLDGTDIWE